MNTEFTYDDSPIALEEYPNVVLLDHEQMLRCSLETYQNSKLTHDELRLELVSAWGFDSLFEMEMYWRSVVQLLSDRGLVPNL